MCLCGCARVPLVAYVPVTACVCVRACVCARALVTQSRCTVAISGGQAACRCPKCQQPGRADAETVFCAVRACVDVTSNVFPARVCRCSKTRPHPAPVFAPARRMPGWPTTRTQVLAELFPSGPQPASRFALAGLSNIPPVPSFAAPPPAPPPVPPPATCVGTAAGARAEAGLVGAGAEAAAVGVAPCGVGLGAGGNWAVLPSDAVLPRPSASPSPGSPVPVGGAGGAAGAAGAAGKGSGRVAGNGPNSAVIAASTAPTGQGAGGSSPCGHVAPARASSLPAATGGEGSGSGGSGGAPPLSAAGAAGVGLGPRVAATGGLPPSRVRPVALPPASQDLWPGDPGDGVGAPVVPLWDLAAGVLQRT